MANARTMIASKQFLTRTSLIIRQSSKKLIQTGSVVDGKSDSSGSSKPSKFIAGAGTPVILEGCSASLSNDHVFHGERVTGARDVYDATKSIERGPQSASNAASNGEVYQPRSNVSLHCVMQSNVPEPYTQRPAHYNMPGNNRKVDQKYVFNALKATHQNRNFHSSVWLQLPSELNGRNIHLFIL